jgi:L-seryl-tRNA(Ser) seleniumtransferase
VQAAVALAAKNPVRLADLQKASGEYLAKQLKCEAAMVTAGAASALTLGTAACMSLGAGRAAAHNIPNDLTGLKTEVVIQKSHRYGYDHAIRNCGIKFVEIETAAQYEAAINERTAMAFFFNAADESKIGREEWIRIAKSKGVPTMNDAAADAPPIANLWNYTKMGFDLVIFSGGKGIRGPQNAGLLLGRRDLIAAAAQHNNPNSDAIGRGMKVSKEQIVGMVAAIDWFLSQTDEGLEVEFRKRAERIAAGLKGLPVKTEIAKPTTVANAIPHLLVRCDPAKVKMKGLEIAGELRKGTPSVELNPQTGRRPAAGLNSDENTLVVGVWMLQPGEDLIVARRIKEVISKASA